MKRILQEQVEADRLRLNQVLENMKKVKDWLKEEEATVKVLRSVLMDEGIQWRPRKRKT